MVGNKKLCEASKKILSDSSFLERRFDPLFVSPLDIASDTSINIHENIRVAICGNELERLVRSVLKCPVIPINVCGYDLFNSIIESKRYSEIATIVKYYKRLPIKNWEKYLTTKVEQHIFHTIDEACKIFQDLKNNKREVVIGASLVNYLAETFGIESIFYYSDKTIYNVLCKAVELIALLEKEAEEKKKIRTMLNYIPVGVISVDRNSHIIACNTTAEENLHGSENLLHQPIQKIITDKDFLSDLSRKRTRLDQIYKINDNMFLTNLIVPNANGETIITLEELDKVNNKTRIIAGDKVHRKKTTLNAFYTFDHIIGQSKVIQTTINKAQKFAKTNSTVLITSESGTGKELFAHSIHSASNRQDSPFVAINCSALPDNLLDSELFGYEEGTFTGAVKGGKKGLFEIAQGGTIFLDEISEISPSLQLKLLRVIHEKEIRRIGGDKITPINVRIIAATNANLWEKIKKDEFREDLYYRLNVLELNIPPLRERKEDIPMIFDTLIKKHDFLLYLRVRPFLPEICSSLMTYSWPGNVRELENIAERFIALLTEEIIDHDTIGEFINSLPFNMSPYLQNYYVTPSKNLSNDIKEIEINLIRNTLKEVNGNMTKASKLLGISRSTIWRKINKSC